MTFSAVARFLAISFVLAAFAATLSASPPPLEATVAVPTQRDIGSVFSAVFTWFEAAVEYAFNFISGDGGGQKGGGKGKTKRHSSKTTGKKYANYQVLRLRPQRDEDVQELRTLEEEQGLEFWSPPVKNTSSDLVVPPDVAEYLREYMVDKDIEFTVLTDNLEAEIKKQNPKPKSRYNVKLLKTDHGHPLTWTRFHRYKDILEYMEYLGTSMPNLVKIITIGKSSENRPLKVAHVSSGKKKDAPVIWIDGGMHGREWIAPSTALFILKQLTENYNTNKGVVDGIDWFIMPMANPDGYEYSHSSDRFWRKNRSKNPSKKYDDYSYYEETRSSRFFWGDDSDSSCQGVDLNRNWDFHWKEVGASGNPCRPTFAGDRPFSEPETRSMSDFIMDHSDRIKAYLSLHSYSQMLLLPWGYTKQNPKDYDDLMYVGRKAVEALQRMYGTPFKIGSSPSLLYPTSGSSDDWAKGKAGIKYSYTLELRDKGTFGFLLPATQIVPTGRETFAAVKTIAKHVASVE